MAAGDPFYFDTSALAKLILNEPESQEMENFVGSTAGQPVSSQVGDVELVRAVVRQDPSGLNAALEVLAQIVLMPTTSSIMLRAAYLAPDSLGSLDAVHLATALEIQTTLQGFVSYDKRLVGAAQDLGIKTFSPGA